MNVADVEEILNQLILANEDPEWRENGASGFMCACQEGWMPEVAAYITLWERADVLNVQVNATQFVNGSGDVGYTGLHMASWFENPNMVNFLLANGASTGMTDTNDQGGTLPLHWAAWKTENELATLDALLENMRINNVNVNHLALNAADEADTDQYTALDWAYGWNHGNLRMQVINLLRAHGGRANCHDANGNYVGSGNGEL